MPSVWPGADTPVGCRSSSCVNLRQLSTWVILVAIYAPLLLLLADYNVKRQHLPQWWIRNRDECRHVSAPAATVLVPQPPPLSTAPLWQPAARRLAAACSLPSACRFILTDPAPTTADGVLFHGVGRRVLGAAGATALHAR